MNRVKVNSNWVAIPNAIIRDKTLSTNARVLFGILMSFAAEFVFRTEYVRDLVGVGRDSYRAAFQELEDRGLARRVRSHSSTGAWIWEIELFPEPSPEIQSMDVLPCPDLPATVQPATVQPATVNQAIKEEQEQEEQYKEEQVEEEGLPPLAQSAGEWLAEMMFGLGIKLSPMQCDAIYMQTRAYMDDDNARRYLGIKSAELVAAGVQPRVIVRALAQDASEYAKRAVQLSAGRPDYYLGEVEKPLPTSFLVSSEQVLNSFDLVGVQKEVHDLLVASGYGDESAYELASRGTDHALSYLQMMDKPTCEKLTLLVNQHRDTVENNERLSAAE